MNTFKKTGGFTLVELIIVIAILAILSSVAVAGYSSYITKANNSAAEQYMANVYQHVVLANAESGAVTSVEFDKDGTTVTVEIAANADFDKDFTSAYPGTTVKPTEANSITKWTITGLTAPTAWVNSDYNVDAGTEWPLKK